VRVYVTGQKGSVPRSGWEVSRARASPWWMMRGMESKLLGSRPGERGGAKSRPHHVSRAAWAGRRCRPGSISCAALDLKFLLVLPLPAVLGPTSWPQSPTPLTSTIPELIPSHRLSTPASTPIKPHCHQLPLRGAGARKRGGAADRIVIARRLPWCGNWVLPCSVSRTSADDRVTVSQTSSKAPARGCTETAHKFCDHCAKGRSGQHERGP
jgi:hypothetical protein